MFKPGREYSKQFGLDIEMWGPELEERPHLNMESNDLKLRF